ncbi:hypothetical protein ZEAMMB73_Zm00001d052938 [Zea mays]|uniref:Uncharacterized protein n=1 Tax=Zea mays TaxID=4577 RepID=A0A1D6QKZ8_MAIZE|nr:hypothetical protein ZEAMMB73_Zm00001d052938 [Zea mays]
MRGKKFTGSWEIPPIFSWLQQARTNDLQTSPLIFSSNYSEKHQALHWRTGHKNDCLQIISSAASNSVLPAVGIGFVRWFAKASNVHRLLVLDPLGLYSVLLYDQLTIHYLRLMALINNSKN